jgi:HAD superfamily hydrolase (TIGR01662 family)
MKTVIFDFDGTIGDTLPVGIEIVNELSDKYGYRKITAEDVPRFQKMEATQILKEMKVSLPKALLIGREVLRMLADRLDTVNIFDGIKDVIETLKYQGYRVGIITKNDLEIVKKILEKTNIQVDFLEKDDTFFKKEKSIKKTMTKQNISPEEVVYVGDELRDIEAARKAGIRIISICWGFNARELLEKNNKVICEKPSKLLPEIKQILG